MPMSRKPISEVVLEITDITSDLSWQRNNKPTATPSK